jgi:hypothetical protein
VAEAERSRFLEAELEHEREHHAFTLSRLEELSKKHSAVMEKAVSLERDLEHTMIERDTLNTALCGMVHSNRLVSAH